MMSKISVRRRLAILGLVLASAAAGTALPALAQDPPPSAWRVECTGDGKSLDCRLSGASKSGPYQVGRTVGIARAWQA